MVDLPAPVWPTRATVVPAGTSRSSPRSTSAPRRYAKRTPSKRTCPVIEDRSCAPGLSATSGCWSSTPMILSSAAAAERNVLYSCDSCCTGSKKFWT